MTKYKRDVICETCNEWISKILFKQHRAECCNIVSWTSKECLILAFNLYILNQHYSSRTWKWSSSIWVQRWRQPRDQSSKICTQKRQPRDQSLRTQWGTYATGVKWNRLKCWRCNFTVWWFVLIKCWTLDFHVI